MERTSWHCPFQMPSAGKSTRSKDTGTVGGRKAQALPSWGLECLPQNILDLKYFSAYLFIAPRKRKQIGTRKDQASREDAVRYGEDSTQKIGAGLRYGDSPVVLFLLI